MLGLPAWAAPEVASHPLAGRVWISPTCAGAQREGDACRSPRAGVDVHLVDAEGRTVGVAKSDAHGAFTLSAPAGQYRLHVMGTSKVLRCPDVKVTLPMADAHGVNLECDSGMR
jgi:hypothetical protein